MRGCKWTERGLVDFAARSVLVVLAASCALGADLPDRIERSDGHTHHQPSVLPASPARVIWTADDLPAIALNHARRFGHRFTSWYLRTPPADRVTWGGMMACAGLGLGVLLERLARLRRGKIVPPEFTARFLDRLHEGKLDCGKALDHCELNPSPAARVALAAVRRWDRPAADQERAVGLAHRVETERLRRNVGTLRRIAVLAPLLGLLGTLFACRTCAGRRSRRTVACVGSTRGGGADSTFDGNHHRHTGLGRLRRLAHSHRETGWSARSSGRGDHRCHRADRTDFVTRHHTLTHAGANPDSPSGIAAQG